MSLAEQVVNALKTDFDEVYQAGVDKGKAQGGIDYFQYATTFQNTFNGADFTNCPNVVLDLKSFKGEQFTQMFFYATGLQSVVIKAPFVEGRTANCQNMFYNCRGLKKIDFTDLKCKIFNITQIFAGCYELEEIIGELNLENVTQATTPFVKCSNLREIRVKENSISVRIEFSHCSSLSDTSIQSIIDGLATVETQHTITFHADVKAKLTEEQKATISAKNWVLG